MNVEPGDILLFRVTSRSPLLDRLIGWGQKVIKQAPSSAAYCHAALVGPDSGRLYEARWPKIHNIPIDWETLRKRNPIEVYRVKDIRPEQVSAVLRFAENRVGRRYDVPAILTFGIIQFGHATVCSQFVWEAFTAADICLCPWEDLESPDDLATSHCLVRIDPH